MKTTTFTLTIILSLIVQISFAQSVGINASGAAPTANAMLEVLQTNTSGTTYGIYGSATGAATTNYGGYFSATGATNNYGLVIPNGNVGIGTISPTYKVEVNGSFLANPIKLDDYSYIQLQNLGGDYDDVVFGFDANDYMAYKRDNNYLMYVIGSTEIMRLNSSGYVGIGTTTPAYPLHVDSYVVAGHQAGYYFSGTSGAITANSGNWNVGIYSANSILTNGAFVAFSDLRIKENIKEVQNSLDLVRKLRPVSYTKIDKIENGGKTELGFIAQEVEEILPEAVNTGTGEIPVLQPFDKVEFEEGVSYTLLVKNGDDIVEQKYTTKDPRPEGEIIVKSKTVDDFKSLSYDMIFTVAVDAIQEQQAQIEAQQAQIEALKAQNTALSQRVEAIDELRAQNTQLNQKALDLDQLKAEVENLKKLVHSNLSQLTNNQ